MKRIIIISALLSILIACGDDKQASTDNKSTSNSKSKATAKLNKQGKILACSILDESYINSKFPGATQIELKDSGTRFPNCGAVFVYNNKNYKFNLTLGVIGGAGESHLESAVSYFRQKNKIESIDGAGEKAYNKTGKSGQISAIHNGNLMHVSAKVDLVYDLELSKTLTNDMFEVLDQ
ncbi:MAG: hypothetical protein KC478_17290 [Bacteriovoracaceae bacterium]|nr:hypothetical protein [Bacteriovoracaceae bacterium]